MSKSPHLDEMLASLDMELYLDSEGHDYKITQGSSGEQLNIRTCPACGKSDYKVYLNAESGLGNCFSGSCPVKKFNKFTFIRACIDGNNRETIEHIEQHALEMGWQRPRKSRPVLLSSNRASLILPESMEIPIKGRNLRYLEERNITIDIARYFHLRFSMKGVFRYKYSGNEVVQSYKNRIIIPIFDMQGELASFQGRDITGTADKKYLFPPEYASTGRYLYNGHNAVGAQSVVIGEGVFDVMAAKIALDSDPALRGVIPIGSFGMSLSTGSGGQDQLSQLIRLQNYGLQEVVMMWDGSSSAIAAACETALLLRRYGFKSRIALLPKDKDPNEVTPDVVCKAYYSAVPATPSDVTRILLGNRH